MTEFQVTGLFVHGNTVEFYVVKLKAPVSLTLRLLMSYIYMEPLFLVFLDHTQRRSTVGRTPLDE